MATETYHPARLLLEIRYSTDLCRDELADLVRRLPCLPADEAEHRVAVAGEDERGYAVLPRDVFVDALFARIDEFLADDDGGFHEMAVYVTRHPHSAAVLEFWFQVATPGSSQPGVWLRQLAVGIDGQRIYAALGANGKANGAD